MTGRARRADRKILPTYYRRIGQLVRDARLERDISAAELGAAIGSDQHHVSSLERGVFRGAGSHGPSTGLIVRIALALGVQPSELMP